jgi:hypothetical protein
MTDGQTTLDDYGLEVTGEQLSSNERIDPEKSVFQEYRESLTYLDEND